jgi:hypothetical protein
MAKGRSMKRKSMKTMKKRRMSKMRHSKKMIRKSRKMRGGGFLDFFTGKKQQQQQNYDMTNEYNSTFENQPRNGKQPIKTFPEKEYVEFRNNPTKYANENPVADITI